MKKYIALYIILAAFPLAGLWLFAGVPGMVPRGGIDYTAVNAIVKQAELCWDEPGRLGQSGFIYRFTVIDGEGRVLYASHPGLPSTQPDAVRLGFMPMDITDGASVIGKAFIEVFPISAEETARGRLASVALFSFLLLCALNFSFLLAFHRMLIKPFNRLEAFAHRIAAGRLDEPLPIDKRNIFGLFTKSFDIMRESLLEARRKQARAERAKKELAASLNHDVKTPVTSIRLIAELLRAGATDPGVTEKLKTIEAKADQIDRLMNDMMHSALEDLGELKVNVTSEDSGILQELLTEAGSLNPVRVGKIPSCLIEIDRVRMEQIIGNIVANADKYAGTPIDAACETDGDLFRIDINDYGGGVGPEELELITAKFYRGENAKASHKDGEGLGLYIAKLLMDKMGGSLEAFNRDDGFTVRLWVRMS